MFVKCSIRLSFMRASEAHTLSACSMVFCAWWLSAASAVNGLVHFDPHFSPLEAALLYAMLFPIVSHVFGLHNPLMQRDKLVLAVK